MYIHILIQSIKLYIMSSKVSSIRKLIQSICYWKLYRKGKVGKNVLLSRHGTVANAHLVTIEDNVFISEYFHIAAHPFKIGRDVIIGPRLTAICNNHIIDRVGQSVYECAADRIYKPIEIEPDSWLGSNVTLLPGVIVGQGCIVGAGSVVNKSLPPYTICVGVPCKPIKTRFNEEELKKHLQAMDWNKLDSDDIIEKWRVYNIKIKQK